MKTTGNKERDMQLLIGNTLRRGVTLACVIALAGGLIYLWKHGSEPMKDYSSFDYHALPAGAETYTTLSGILDGVAHFTAAGWIQLGVIALLLTPVMRVLLSLCDFVLQRDWLYAAISAVVLAVIVCNSLGGTV